MHDEPLNKPEDDQPSQANPYLAAEGHTPFATADASPLPDRPPVWTVFAVCILTLVVLLFASVLFGFIANWQVNSKTGPPVPDDAGSLMKDRLGFVLMSLPTQLSFAIPAICAAILSPVAFKKRLGFQRGQWPWFVWIAAAFATPFVGAITSIFLSGQDSESLTSMTEAFRHHINSGFIIPIFLLVSIAPGICEEILFRGYIQTRLVQRMNFVVAIGLSSFMFALAHLDPIHVLGVIPIGLWLGFVRYSSGSIFPAMLAHAVNNAFAIIAIMPDEAKQTDMPTLYLGAFLLIFGLPSLVVTIVYAAVAANSAGVDVGPENSEPESSEPQNQFG